MKLKFGVNAWVWTSPVTTADLEKLAPHVRTLGFDWIEIPLEQVSDIDPVRVAQILAREELGVSVCAAMGPDRDLIHPDPAVRDTGMQYIRDAVDVAAALGATSLVGPMYSSVGRAWQQTSVERQSDEALLVEQYRSLCEHAALRNVVLCIEPLNRFETSFLNLTAQAVDIVDRVNHPHCQIMIDTFHANIEEKSTAAAIRAAGRRLHHVHACENDRGAPGSGNVAWGEVATALRDIDYEGAIVIESFTNKVKSIARAAAIWRPLAATQDDLARDGLTFLRQLMA
ncbi:MAG: sugar phosphate isomerase/epimerase family protein [Vicinamibacterales bacterium]